MVLELVLVFLFGSVGFFSSFIILVPSPIHQKGAISFSLFSPKRFTYIPFVLELRLYKCTYFSFFFTWIFLLVAFGFSWI